MASSATSKAKMVIEHSKAMAYAALWYCAILFLALTLLGSMRESSLTHHDTTLQGNYQRLLSRPCDETYVVGKGETLHTISDKCGDPFIVERNPHIHDVDDVFPGLIIKITPSIPS